MKKRILTAVVMSSIHAGVTLTHVDVVSTVAAADLLLIYDRDWVKTQSRFVTTQIFRIARM